MNSFEESIYNYLKESKGEYKTVYQVANALGIAVSGMMVAKSLKSSDSQGYIIGIQIVRNALDNLVNLGLITKTSFTEGLIKEYYYVINE